MDEHNRLQPKKVRMLGTIFGGLLIGLPAIPFAASAAPSAVLNPCPRIYYEEPYNSTRQVPQGCPPNQATRLQSAPTTPAQVVPTPNQSGAATTEVTPGVTNPSGTTQTPPVQPPLPEERAQPIAMVMPTNGTVDVRLKNNTNALVTYEAIGHTGRRTLPGGEEVVLRDVPVPVTITTVRQDKGLVDVAAVSSQEGLLEVSLNESKDLDDDAGVLRIQQDGQVFLN